MSAGKKYRPIEEVDFCIVGSGAAGAVLARELSQAGHSVVVLERGPYLSKEHFLGHDELKYWFLNELMPDMQKQPQTFRRTPDDKAQPPQGGFPYMIYAQNVGGSSVHYTANCWRFRESDFKERSLIGEISGTGFADWPITYAEMEPYYTKVDWDIGVSGLAGADPTEPYRSKPYPMPPLPVKSSGVLFEKGARKIGLHPVPAPMAINSVPYDGRSACVHCGFCMGFGCEMGAKSSTLFNMIPQAEATGNCEIRPDCNVFQVSMNNRGRTDGVIYFDKRGKRFKQNSKAVILSANGAETARLLLLSKNKKHPDGLANSSGFVGKYMMFNGYNDVGALFDEPLNESKSVQVTRVLFDFYEHDSKRGFYGGGGIDARLGYHPILWAAFGMPPDVPNWGSEYKAMLRDFPNITYGAVHTTSLALEQNGISLDPDVKDEFGLPAMRVTYNDHPDDISMMRFLQKKTKEIYDAAGAKKTWHYPAGPQSFGAHLLGTARMGNNPKTSVVDKYHRTHDIDNLFLCDGSSFVTSGRGQPTMTIQALAFRAAEHISKFAKSNQI